MSESTEQGASPRVPALRFVTSVCLVFDNEPTWAELRAYVKACEHIPDAEPIGFGFDEDEWPKIPGLEECIVTHEGDG